MENYKIMISKYSYDAYTKSRIPTETLNEYRNTFVLLFNDTWNDMGYYSWFYIVYFNGVLSSELIGSIKLFHKNMNLNNNSSYNNTYAQNTTYHFLKNDNLIETTFSELSANYYSISNIKTYNSLLRILKSDKSVTDFLFKLNEISTLNNNVITNIEELDWYKESLLRDFNITKKNNELIVSFTKLKNGLSLNYNSYYLLKNFSNYIKKSNHNQITTFLTWINENKLKMEFSIAKKILINLELLKNEKRQIFNNNIELIKQILCYFKKVYGKYTGFVQRIDTLLNVNTQLYEIIKVIKDELKVDLNNLKENSIDLGHYTSLDTLYKLITPQSENPYLRLTNARQMNDPLEGKIILDYITNDNKNIWEPTTKFIASLTSNKDNLPMWNHYAKDAKGVILIYSEDYLQEISKIECIDIYKVAYVDLQNGELKVKISHDIGEDTAKNLEDAINDLKNLKEEEKDINVLQEIDFLFKKSDYSYENEYRIIANTENDENYDLEAKIEQNSMYNFPFVYQYLKRPLKYSKLILGPKSINIDFIAPYINHCDTDIEIKESEISFR